MTSPTRFRGAFRTDERARALYSEGAGVFRVVPAAVAVPLDAVDLAELVRWARDAGTPLIPRGAGSGMPGGNVGPGVVVDLTRGLRTPPVVDPEHRLARAGAAVSHRALCEAAAPHGLVLPPDPSSGRFCTLGGMVAANAAGAHSLRHGAMRRWVRGLGFVTADGEAGRTDARTQGRTDARDGATVRPYARTLAEGRFRTEVAADIRRAARELAVAAPHTAKNSAGYDLATFARTGEVCDLLVGSEGTLAFVTDVEVALAPLAARRTTLLVALASLEDVGPAVSALLPLEPAALELLDRTYLDFVRADARRPLPPGTEAVLLVELETEGSGAADAVRGLATAVEHADDPADVEALWELRHLASPRIAQLPDGRRSLQVVEDGCVPVPRLGEYVAALRAAARRNGVEVVVFGHAGDGHLHANVIADVRSGDLRERLSRVVEEVTAAQLALGGTPSGEHGDGRLRAAFVERLYGATWASLSRRVKAAWDPAGILNPGVVVPLEGAGPLDLPLKVGPDAPALPAGVAEELRRVEREALWGMDLLGLARGS